MYLTPLQPAPVPSLKDSKGREKAEKLFEEEDLVAYGEQLSDGHSSLMVTIDRLQLNAIDPSLGYDRAIASVLLRRLVFDSLYEVALGIILSGRERSYHFAVTLEHVGVA